VLIRKPKKKSDTRISQFSVQISIVRPVLKSGTLLIQGPARKHDDL
jgi:hypothetical protein